MKKLSCALALALVAIGVIATGSQAAPQASSAEPLTVPGRWIVVAPSKAAYQTMMARATATERSSSFRVATALPQLNAVAVNGTERVVQAFAKKGKGTVLKDRILHLQSPQFRREMGLRDLKDVKITDLANR